MTEQNETQEIEPNTNESKVNEVIIVKKRNLTLLSLIKLFIINKFCLNNLF